jgi:hypothetical protein
MKIPYIFPSVSFVPLWLPPPYSTGTSRPMSVER